MEKRIDYIFSYGPEDSLNAEKWSGFSALVESGAALRLSYDGYCGDLQMLTRKELVSCLGKRIVYGFVISDTYKYTTYNISGVKLDDIVVEVINAKTAD